MRYSGREQPSRLALVIVETPNADRPLASHPVKQRNHRLQLSDRLALTVPEAAA